MDTGYGQEHDYREPASVWFRSIFTLDPRGEALHRLPQPRRAAEPDQPIGSEPQRRGW